MSLPTIPSQTSLAAALSSAQVNEPQEGSVLYAKFDFKTGEYMAGKDNEILTEESVIVMTDAFAHGWVCWSGGKPYKIMVNFTEALPPQPAPIGQDFYKEARAIQFKTVDGEIEAILEGSSYGIKKGVDSLLLEIKKRAADPANADYLYPQVCLESESYKHETGNLIHNPVFRIEDWCNIDGNPQQAPEPVKVIEDAPRRRRK
jgi:hypothetical protein